MEAQPLQHDRDVVPQPTLHRLQHALSSIMVATHSRLENELENRSQTTLAWGRSYLPAHFAKPASRMHEWLGAELDAMRADRGARVNLIGPRGSAKSTFKSLLFVLHDLAYEREPYILLFSATLPQAEQRLKNLRREIERNDHLRAVYGDALAPSGPASRRAF